LISSVTDGICMNTLHSISVVGMCRSGLFMAGLHRECPRCATFFLQYRRILAITQYWWAVSPPIILL
jgi:hypothetical protein